MNQGRIWCVVSPTVGLPLLLGSVTAISFIVHASVMTHTTWMGNYWQGTPKVRVSDSGGMAPQASAAPQGEPAFVLSIAPVAGTPGKAESSFVVTVSPNLAATANASASVASVETPLQAAKVPAATASN